MDQVFVYGDSLQNNLIAIVVPNKEITQTWCEENKIQNQDYEALLQEKPVNDHFISIFKDIAKKQGLFGFEVPQKVYLSAEEFSTENGCLTWTMKQNRIAIKEKFSTQIEAMYAK